MGESEFVSMVDTMLKFVVVSLLIAGVFGGDEGKEKVVKVKNTYPATHNILGNLYNTKHGHAIHEYYGHGSDHGYEHGVHRHHSGYGQSFNKGRVMAYSHGDLIYPNKLDGYIVQVTGTGTTDTHGRGMWTTIMPGVWVIPRTTGMKSPKDMEGWSRTSLTTMIMQKTYMDTLVTILKMSGMDINIGRFYALTMYVLSYK